MAQELAASADRAAAFEQPQAVNPAFRLAVDQTPLFGWRRSRYGRTMTLMAWR